jgi:hypothetical protein
MVQNDPELGDSLLQELDIALGFADEPEPPPPAGWW